MKNYNFCILIVGVFFGMASCDIKCYNEKLADPSHENSLAGIDQACMNYKGLLDDLRGYVKDCSVGKISFDGVESFFKEFCAEYSPIRQGLIDNQDCIMESLSKKPACLPTIFGSTDLEQLKDQCKKRATLLDCINQEVGKPCGDGGLKFVTSVTQAMESYLKGYCYEAGSAVANTAFTWSILLGVLISIVKWNIY